LPKPSDARKQQKKKQNESNRHSQRQQYETRLRNIKIKRAHMDQMPSGRLEQTGKRKEVGKKQIGERSGERIGCREPNPDQAGWEKDRGNSQSM
jgi:Zn/Cd-binding protein ZinT